MEALDGLNSVQQQGLSRGLDSSEKTASFVRLLQQHGDQKSLSAGRHLHSQVARAGLDRDTYLGNLIVRMYSKCGSLDDARQAFERIHRPDSVSWNSIMAAYIKCGEIEQARRVFDSMPRKSIVSWNAIIVAYAQSRHMEIAKGLFDAAPCKDVATWNGILTGYADNGLVSDAKNVFEKMPERNVVSWNALIAALAKNWHFDKAFAAFARMDVQPNAVTFVTVLDACVGAGATGGGLAAGRHVFARATAMGMVGAEIKVGNALVNMFAKCGSLEDARATFDLMPRKNARSSTIMIAALGSFGRLEEARSLLDSMEIKTLFAWNAMISAYAQAGRARDALETFERMDVEPDSITFIGVLEAASWTGDLSTGLHAHASMARCGIHVDTHVGNALVNMYGKCGSVAHAREAFEAVRDKNVVTWTCMISVYAQNRHASAAFRTFQLMDLHGVASNEVTLANVADACAELAEFPGMAKAVHEVAMELELDRDVVLGSALVTMHGKCGNLGAARRAFDRIERRNLVSWTAMIAALAENGDREGAWDLFRAMELEGIEPDEVCFMGVLAACKNAGEIQTGFEYFQSMTEDYSMDPSPGHYTFLIDLLARSGKLELAEDLIRGMPFEPQAWTWTSLLGACKIHWDERRGAMAAQRALVIDPRRTAAYVILSDICGKNSVGV